MTIYTYIYIYIYIDLLVAGLSTLSFNSCSFSSSPCWSELFDYFMFLSSWETPESSYTVFGVLGNNCTGVSFDCEPCYMFSPSGLLLLVLSDHVLHSAQHLNYFNVFTQRYSHHHHVVPLARISLTLSRHFSLSFIASGRSSGLHSVSSQSCCMYVRAGRPAFARSYEGVHRSTSLLSSSLLLQQCPACLVRLAWIVFVMVGVGGRIVGALRGVAARTCSILLETFLCNCRLVSVQVVHPYSSIDTTAAWKKLRFILSVRSDIHRIDSLSIAVHAFVSRVSMSFSVDETLLPGEFVYQFQRGSV